jgi:signal peptidase II
MSKVFLSAGWCRAVCLFAAIAVAGTAADLLSKHRAFQTLGMPGEYKADTEKELNAIYWIKTDIVGFQTSLNTGALFGLGEGRTTFLAILSLIFLTGIVSYVLFWAWRSLFLSTILGMITAGICGNLYDRLGWHGLVYPDWHPMAGQQIYAVRDWIHCMIGTLPWPNFNIADSLLVCSVILLLLHELLAKNSPDLSKCPTTSDDVTPSPTAR